MATWGELEKAGTKWRDLEEMTWGELEEFCVINPKTKQIPDDMEVSFVPMQSVSDTGAVQTDEVRKASEVKKGFTFFEEGDVLFAKITPCMENGKGGIARGLKNGVGFGSTEFHVLHPAPEKVSSEWLYYLTSWDEFRKQCARNMTGSAGQKRVPKSYLEHYKVHLPSLEEQRRIAAVLDKVSGLIAKRREQLDKLDELLKARFVEMFGDPVSNPHQYPISQLSEYIEFLTSGSRGWSQYFSDDGEYFITIKNVKNCSISLEDVQYIKPPDNAEAVRTKVKDGDLLISITADLGRTGVVTKEIADHGAYINQHLTCIRLNREKLNPLYVAYYMESLAGKMQFNAKNQAGVKAGLNFNAINSLKLVVPPLEKQGLFVEFVSQTDKSKLTIQQSLDKLEVLKKALMQQYFGGN